MASKTDAIAKLVIVFFISLLSFSIGTFVGKNYSDNQHQLAALEPSSQKAEKADRSVASVHEEGNNKPGAMTDEEIAKLAEEFVSDEAPTTAGHGDEHAAEGAHGAVAGHGEAKAPAHGAATSAKNEAAHGGGHETATEKPEAKAEAHSPRGGSAKGVTANEPSTAAKNLAAGKVPATTENKPAAKATAEERRPSSLPKDVAAFSVGKFTVQVASYPDEAEAQKHASNLKDKGYSAFYVPANIKGKTYYRVSVGQFATQKEAQSYRADFIGKAKVSSAIVQKITE